MAGKGQADGCCEGCAKWLLIIFNIVFCLLGIGFIAAGAYAYVELSVYLNIVGNEAINAPAIVLIVFGCITFIIAAIGCIGACKESPCLLFTFAVIIGLLLIAEIAVGIVAFVYKDQIDEWFDEYAPQSMATYDETKNDVIQDAWDTVQKEFTCCGISGSSDWKNASIAIEQAPKVPASCGDTPDQRSGCKDAIVKFIEDNILIVGGVAIAFGLVELLGIVFACCLGCNAKRGQMA